MSDSDDNSRASTLAISIPTELHSELAADAAREGVDVETHVQHLLHQARQLREQLSERERALLNAGLANLLIHEKPSKEGDVDIDELFRQLDHDRQSGALGRVVAPAETYPFGASKEFPGLIEQLQPDGTVKVGEWKNKRFKVYFHRKR